MRFWTCVDDVLFESKLQQLLLWLTLTCHVVVVFANVYVGWFRFRRVLLPPGCGSAPSAASSPPARCSVPSPALVQSSELLDREQPTSLALPA